MTRVPQNTLDFTRPRHQQQLPAGWILSINAVKSPR